MSHPLRLDSDDLDGAMLRLDHEDRNSVRMWRAVIAQAIRDMTSVDVSTALEAAQWLGTKDYYEVCQLALVDGEKLDAAIREAMLATNPLYRKAAASVLADAITSYSVGSGAPLGSPLIEP